LYFKAEDCAMYETTDGYHLDKSSAFIYTKKFVKELLNFSSTANEEKFKVHH
jgi:hypothetical protein